MKWILIKSYEWSDDYKCSNCKKIFNISADSDYALFKYPKCPNCKEKQS